MTADRVRDDLAEIQIEASGLVKCFDGQRAVDSISLTAAKGEFLGLLGPNGAGKTTTIHLLLGLTTPDAGKIKIFNLELAKRRREILSRVNFSSAYVALPGNLTVWESLYVFTRLYGISAARTRIAETLDLVEFKESPKKLVGALSAGQKTRLNLCKALLNRPEILFLDEPSASLDPDIAQKVRTTLHNIQAERKTTIVYTSHNMREVEELCDRIIFLARGRIVAAGSPAEVLNKTGSRSLDELFISIARDGELKDQSGVEAY